MHKKEHKHNKKINWKSFFKPNKEKIIWSIILAITLIILTMSPIAIIFMVFYFANSVLSNLFFHFGVNYFYLSIIFLILMAYPFSCYISVKKKKIKGILSYFLTIIVITFVAYSLIDSYNNHYGKTCEVDSDCSFSCGEGSHNNKYFSLKSPFVMVDCFGQIASFCNNNQCESFDPKDVKNMEDCKRISNSRNECYKNSAEAQNNFTICNEINDSSIKNSCFTSIASKQNNSNICYNIYDNSTKEECISLVAQNTKSIQLCYSIKKQDIKDSCISYIAQITRDIGLCDKTSSLEKCHEIFYLENCDLLGKDIDSNNIDYNNYFIIQIVKGDEKSSPYKCRTLYLWEYYPCSNLGCSINNIAELDTDSNGRVLVNKSIIKLNTEYIVAWQNSPNANILNFNLADYSTKEIKGTNYYS